MASRAFLVCDLCQANFDDGAPNFSVHQARRTAIVKHGWRYFPREAESRPWRHCDVCAECWGNANGNLP